MDDLIPFFIATIFVSALMVPLLYPLLKKKLGLVLAIVPLALFVLLAFNLTSVTPQFTVLPKAMFSFLPGLAASFRLDGLSMVFGLLVSGIGVLVVLYATFYMAKYQRQAHFYTYLMLFMGAMTGLVFSDNLMGLFIFWELTSVSSFLLIGFDHHLEKSRQAALQSLLITGLGGLCLLFAVILIGQITGTYELSALLEQGVSLTQHPQYPLVFGLVLLAVLTKSAQFPFHFWLPGAMQAPTPVSSYLHSATMVNAGIFLLLRIHPLLGETLMWKSTLVLSGAITMFLGAFFSMGQRDFKRILAFTTISALGTMVLLIGIDTEQSMKAALVFFIVHGLYKGGLFMVAGILDKATGTRDIKVLGHIWKPMPLTTLAAAFALISMAGLPPMLGFIGKELIYDAKIQLPALASWILPLGVGANILMVAISLTVFIEVFWAGKRKQPVEMKHREGEFKWYFLAGPVVLGLAGLVLGLMPGVLDSLIGNALYVSRGEVIDVHLSLWHGFNQVLMLSLFTVISGIGVFWIRSRTAQFIASILNWFEKFNMARAFTKVINWYVKAAGKQTAWIQHGYHRFYLMTFFVVTSILVVWQMLGSGFSFSEIETFSPLKVHILLLLFVSSLAVLFAVITPSRLAAILAMGVVGYGVGMIYLFYGGIDLAITQFLAETVVMVLFVMVIYYLPGFAALSSKKSRIRDAIISIGVGVVVTLIVLQARFVNLHEPISGFFAENSLTRGHGRNIVNVILVDFRALDTLGEVTVLTLAAVGVYSLFRFKIKEPKAKKESHEEKESK
jgi:multicomponent Na+:H+ antiporter subunit A